MEDDRQISRSPHAELRDTPPLAIATPVRPPFAPPEVAPDAPRIAFIDADETYRMAMASCLRTEGFRVVEFADPDIAVEEIVAAGNVVSALIDADMYRNAGAALHERLQGAEASLPFAVLAERRENGSEEKALELGAADYIEKSSTPTVVALRLRLLIDGVRVAGLSEASGAESALDVGALTLRLESCRALWHGAEVPLTVAQFKIVRLLAYETGRDFSFREIYDVVHGVNFSAGDGPDGFRMNVRSLIRKIRARFRSIERDFAEIENVAGYGYRWRQAGGDEAGLPASAAAKRSPVGTEAWTRAIDGNPE